MNQKIVSSCAPFMRSLMRTRYDVTEQTDYDVNRDVMVVPFFLHFGTEIDNIVIKPLRRAAAWLSFRFFLADFISISSLNIVQSLDRNFLDNLVVVLLFELCRYPTNFGIEPAGNARWLRTISQSMHIMSRSIRLLDCLRPSACRIALIFLHTELSVADFAVHRKKIEILWRNAVFKCAADSGANFLYRHFCTDAHGTPDARTSWLPDLICGDFDSAEPEVLKFFKSFPSVRIEKTPDQDATDFTKALKLVGEIIRKRSGHGEPDGAHLSSQHVDMIVAVCSGRGRFDHSMGNINTLFSSAQYTNLPVILMSETDLQYVIPGGTGHTLVLDTGLEGPYCGLLPLSGPSVVSTSGLKWNLFSETLSFGGLISTSNSLDSETVMVKCSEPLLWTMSVQNVE